MNRFKPTIFSGLMMLLLTANTFAQPTDYYWVGGSGNWSDFENHWAKESGGSEFHTAPPSDSDDVIFDGNSFLEEGDTVVIDVLEAYCQNLTWEGVANNPTFYAPAFENKLNVNGSLLLSPEMNSQLRQIHFISTEVENIIGTAGKRPGTYANFYFDGSGAYSFQDSVSVYALIVNAGTLFFNDQPVLATNGFKTAGNDAKQLYLGSSNIYVRGGGWNLDAFNVSLDAGSSTIIIEEGDFDPDGTYDEGPYTYNHIKFTGNVNFLTGVANHKILGSGSFNKIETTQSGATLNIASGHTLTVDELLIQATRSGFVTIQSGTEGNEAYISSSAGSLNLEYVKLKDLHGIGAASYTADNSVDLGNTSGWTINAPTPRSYFWVGGSGQWSDYANHWSSESGNNAFHDSAPSEFDNVYFDENSFSSSTDVVSFEGSARFHVANLDLSGSLEGTQIDINAGILFIHGSLTMGNEGTMLYAGASGGYNAELVFAGADNHSIDTQGRFLDIEVRIDCPGYYALSSDLDIHGSFTAFRLRRGALDFNGYKVTAYATDIYTESTLDFYLETGTLETVSLSINDPDESIGFHMNGSLVSFSNQYSSNVQPSYTSNRNIAFNNVAFQSYDQGVSVVLYSDMTVNFDATLFYSTLQIKSGKTLSLSNLYVFSDGISTTKIQTDEEGVQATIEANTGTIDISSVSIRDIIASNGEFNAYECLDEGNNSGWTFTYDQTPPTFTTFPYASEISDTSFEINFKVDESSDVYLVVLTDGAPTPSAENIVNGKDSFGNPALFASSLLNLDSDVDSVITVTGLSGSTPYDVFLVAIDKAITPNPSSLTLAEALTLPSPRDLYWVGNSGNWSDYSNHWATESGGTTFHSSAPSLYDNVIFDENSFSTSSTVTIDGDQTCKDLDASNITNNITFSPVNYSNDYLYIYGNYIGSQNLDNQLFYTHFKGEGDLSLAGNGGQLAIYLYFNNEQGNWNIENGASTITGLFLDAGSLAFSEDSIQISYLYFQNTGQAKTFDISNKILVAGYWRAYDQSEVTLLDEESQFYVYAIENYNNSPVILDNATLFSTSATSSFSGNISIGELTLMPGTTLEIEMGSTLTTDQLYAAGTFDQPITISSSDVDNQAFIIQTNGAVNGSHLILFGIDASGGAVFNAVNSEDLGNNSGWVFNTVNEIDFPALVEQTYGDDPIELSASANSGLEVSYSSSNPEVAVVGQASFVETFAQCNNYDGWLVHNELGDQAWACDIFGNNGTNGFGINGYLGAPVPNEDWLISPKRFISEGEYLGFDIERRFDGTDLMVLISADYDGESNPYTATWFDLGVTIPAPAAINDVWTTLDNIDLSSYYNSDIHLAFVYQSTETEASRYNIDNIKIYTPGTDNYLSIVGAGTTNITASQAGDEDYPEANPVTQAFVVNKASQTLDFENFPDSVATGNQIVIEAITSSGLAASYFIYEGGELVEVNNETSTAIADGLVTIAAYIEADDNYLASDTIYQSLTIYTIPTYSVTFKVDMRRQISINEIVSVAGDFQEAAGFASNWEPGQVILTDADQDSIYEISLILPEGTYSYKFVNGPSWDFGEFVPQECGVFGFIDEDETNIYNRSFDLNSNIELPSVCFSSCISCEDVPKISQEISLEDIPDKTFGDESFEVFAESSVGLPITYMATTDNISIEGNVVTILGAGLAKVLALNTGTNAYALGALEKQFMIHKASQTVSLTDIPDKDITDSPFDLEVDVSSNLEPTIVVSGPAEIFERTITLTGTTGMVSIEVYQIGDNNYLPSDTVVKVFNVIDNSKQNQSISFEAVSDKTYGDAPFGLGVSASSQLEVSFEVIEGSELVSMDGNAVTILGTGNVTIRATQDGNEEFNPANPVDRSFMINKSDQTLSFDPLENKTFGDGPVELIAGSSSALSVDFEIVSGGEFVSLAGSMLTITGAGTANIRAVQSGNENYNPAPPLEQSLTIEKANQTISFGVISNKLTTDVSFVLSNVSASSGLPISFEVLSGPISISGNTVTITGPGNASIRAIQSGNNNFNAAEPVSQGFEISDPNKQNQVVNFVSVGDKTFGDAAFTISASSSSGLPISFNIFSGPATVSGNVVTLTGEGVVVIRASQAGNTQFNAAQAFQSFCSNPTRPQITNSLGTTTLCDEATTILSAPNDYNGYLWSTGETTPSISVSTAANYTVVVITADGCSSVASNPVSIVTSTSKTLEASIVADDLSVCSGIDISFNLTINHPGANPEISWLVNGNSVQNGGLTFSSTTLTHEDEVGATVVVNDVACLQTNDVTSNTLVVEILEAPQATITASGPDLTATTGQSYRWFFDDELISLNTKTVNVTKRGSYAVEVTYASGCVSRSADVEVSVIGIEDALVQTLKLYPNPAFDKVSVELTEPFNQKVPIIIMDPTGKIISVLELAQGQTIKEIYLDDIRPGLYIISIQTDEVLWQGKIMKQ